MKSFQKWLTVAGCIAAAIWPHAASAAGYNIYELSASLLGMAGAGTAGVNNASALYYNPAAMVRLEGNQFTGGLNLITPTTRFTGGSPVTRQNASEETRRRLFFPFGGYYTRHYGSNWAAGVGVNTPFGLGVTWKDVERFTGRYVVTRADLITANLVAGGSYAFNDRWSAGGGLDVFLTKAKLSRTAVNPSPPAPAPDLSVAGIELESDLGAAPGWNAGLLYVSGSGWRVGASYHSKVVVHVDGDARFTQIATGIAPYDAAVASLLPPNQRASLTLRFPAIWSLGVAWSPRADWTVEVDGNWTEWSLVEDIPIHLRQTPAASLRIVEDYQDGFQVRTGAEHRRGAFAWRFGYYFDQAAAPIESVSPILPDADRHGVTLGFSRRFGADGAWSLDVYELAMFVKDRNTAGRNRDAFDGAYESFLNSFGVGFSRRWK